MKIFQTNIYTNFHFDDEIEDSDEGFDLNYEIDNFDLNPTIDKTEKEYNQPNDILFDLDLEEDNNMSENNAPKYDLKDLKWVKCRATKNCEGNQVIKVRELVDHGMSSLAFVPPKVVYKCVTCNKQFCV